MIDKLKHCGNCTVIKAVNKAVCTERKCENIAEIKHKCYACVSCNSEKSAAHFCLIVIGLVFIGIICDFFLYGKRFYHKQTCDSLLNKRACFALGFLHLFMQAFERFAKQLHAKEHRTTADKKEKCKNFVDNDKITKGTKQFYKQIEHIRQNRCKSVGNDNDIVKHSVLQLARMVFCDACIVFFHYDLEHMLFKFPFKLALAALQH